MGEVAELRPPEEAQAVEPEVAVETEPQEVPSVVAVTNRYLVGSVDVGDPSEDGSRLLRLHSASGATVIEANLSPQVWDFLRIKSTEVKIVTQDDEVESADAPTEKG